MTSTSAHAVGTMPASTRESAIGDLRREFGARWEIVAIPQGYRGVLRDPAGHAPVALYGRTPAELAESIRVAEASP